MSNSIADLTAALAAETTAENTLGTKLTAALAILTTDIKALATAAASGADVTAQVATVQAHISELAGFAKQIDAVVPPAPGPIAPTPTP